MLKAVFFVVHISWKWVLLPALFHIFLSSPQCGNHGNFLSYFFHKNFGKATFLLNKLLKSWFHEFFFFRILYPKKVYKIWQYQYILGSSYWFYYQSEIILLHVQFHELQFATIECQMGNCRSNFRHHQNVHRCQTISRYKKDQFLA